MPSTRPDSTLLICRLRTHSHSHSHSSSSPQTRLTSLLPFATISDTSSCAPLYKSPSLSLSNSTSTPTKNPTLICTSRNFLSAARETAHLVERRPCALCRACTPDGRTLTRASLLVFLPNHNHLIGLVSKMSPLPQNHNVLRFFSRREDQSVTKPTDPHGLVLEAWAEGYMIGSLIIMSCITLANMRRGVLLHKLILLEVCVFRVSPAETPSLSVAADASCVI